MQEPTRQRTISRFAWIVLIIALVLRVVITFAAFTGDDPYSGDGPYYILNAQEVWRLGIPDRDVIGEWLSATTSIGPLYPVYLIPFYTLISDAAPAAQMLGARLGQMLLDTLTVLLVYLLAHRLFGERAGRVALVAQALDLRYIFAAGTITTEPMFIMLFSAFMLLYVLAITGPEPLKKPALTRWAGVLLGLAMLTRPVPILYPVILIAHALVSRKQHPQIMRRVLGLIGVTILVIAPWVTRTSYITGELTPISDTFSVHFWRATRNDGREVNTNEELEEAIGEDTGYGEDDTNTEIIEYLQAAFGHIFSKPGQWIGRIAGETLRAYLQPYSTVILTPTGAGIKQTLSDVLSGDASLRDLFAVPAFWRRLLMYIWHYWALIGGTAGIVLTLKTRWRELFPMLGWIVYLTGVSALMLIEPRYIFPQMFVFTVMAAYATTRLWNWLTPYLHKSRKSL